MYCSNLKIAVVCGCYCIYKMPTVRISQFFTRLSKHDLYYPPTFMLYNASCFGMLESVIHYQVLLLVFVCFYSFFGALFRVFVHVVLYSGNDVHRKCTFRHFRYFLAFPSSLIYVNTFGEMC